jgi:hypothetical protein
MKKQIVMLLLAPMLAQATLTPNKPGRGAELIKLSRGEICYIPNRLDGADYSKKDLERERDLCGLNFGTGDAQSTAAVCGKTVSTNPALELFQIPEGMTASQVQAMNCERKETVTQKDFKKLAKYKLSTSCSYTPSLLAYYHVSRFLGNINQVPPVVMRTVEASVHKSIGDKTYALIPKKTDLIAETWAGLLSILTKKQAHPKATNIFTDDYGYSFGALQMNPSKEEKYTEMYNGGADQPTRTANFKAKNPTYQRLISDAKLANAGLKWSAAQAQVVLQMQNVADMILLDTMLSQQDRLGNLHYTMERYGKVTDKTGKVNIKKLDKDDTTATEVIELKRMMMKDNDCGVAKENHLKNGKLLEALKHFNPETFTKLLKLNKVINSAAGQAYFTNETAMNNTDIATFKANVGHAVNVLTKTCQAGQLTLDLDLDSAFAGQAVPDCRVILQSNQ